MLKQMREGAKSTLLKLILFGMLLLAMAGLALTDVQGMFGRGMTNATVASLGREKITSLEFDRIVQKTLQGQRIKQSDAYRAGLPLKILQHEIDQRLFSGEAKELGLEINDALAAQQINKILTEALATGMSQQEALQRLLTAYNMSENQLVAALKGQMATQQLLDTLMSGVHAPRQLVHDMLRHKHEWRRGEYFTLTADSAGPGKEPSEKELKSYYESLAGEYALPEYRTLSVLMLDQKSLGDAVKIADEQLKRYYDDNIQDYQTPATRVIAQAIAPDKKSAEEIYAAAVKSGDLQKSAGKATYIKPAALTEAAMPLELSKAAFAATASQLLPPVETPLGWHILSIEKISPAVTKSFDSVKASIEKDLAQDKISTALYERANAIDDEIAGGKTLAEVAKENNIGVTFLKEIDARGMDRSGKKPMTGLPLPDKIVTHGFSLQKSAASPLIETPEGAFLIVSAEDIFPSRQQPFAQMRNEVLTRWKTNNQMKALSAVSAAVMSRLQKGESFEKIAGEFGKTIQSTALLERGTPAFKAGVTDNLMTALFSIDKPGQATSVSGDASLTLLRLAERKINMPSVADKEESAALTSVLNRALKQGLLESYRTSLMEKHDVTINDQLLDEMYTPKNDEAGTEE